MKTVDVMIPVYIGNLHEIEPCLAELVPCLSNSLRNYEWKIIFAVNGKNPEKLISLIEKINSSDKRVWYDAIEKPGKGSGIINAWSNSKAEILAYMDVDLSTDISNFHELIEGIEK